MAGYPKILHAEEAMREGLQLEGANIAVEAKIRLYDVPSETALKEIAIGFFASPKGAAQMACIETYPEVSPEARREIYAATYGRN